MEFASLIGIALWALIPGFIAKNKERSFWGYFFLSFLITPLITTIITLFLSKKTENNNIPKSQNNVKYNVTHRVTECISCGYRDPIYFAECPKCGKSATRYVNLDSETHVDADKISFCRKCGEKLIDNSEFCRKCGTKVAKE